MRGFGGGLGAEPPAAGGHLGSGGEAQPPENGGLRQSPQPPEARGLEAELSDTGRFLHFFKITHFYAYFGQNSYFKAITHQLKEFKISLNVLNRKNEDQVL